MIGKLVDKVRLYDRVELDDGRVGAVLEVYGDGEAFEVEFESPDGDSLYTFEAVEKDRVIKVVSRQEEC